MGRAKSCRFKIVLDQIELVLSVVSTACRWFKIILKEFEPNTPNRFLFFVGGNCYEYRFDDKCCNSLGRQIAFGRDILLQATDLTLVLYFF
jgi:hypothetical protein